MIFQWNRKKGWNPTDRYFENWDRSIPLGTKWYAENDPCPKGWRVPTREELRSLGDFRRLGEADSEWTTQNGVNGRLFGTAPNQIFLPAVGHTTYVTVTRGWHGESSVATFDDVNRSSGYWSSSSVENGFTTALWFNEDFASVHISARCHGLSIRCVAKD